MFPSADLLFSGKEKRETVLDLKRICFRARVSFTEGEHKAPSSDGGLSYEFFFLIITKKRVDATVILHHKFNWFVSRVFVKCKHCYFLFENENFHSL